MSKRIELEKFKEHFLHDEFNTPFKEVVLPLKLKAGQELYPDKTFDEIKQEFLNDTKQILENESENLLAFFGFIEKHKKDYNGLFDLCEFEGKQIGLLMMGEERTKAYFKDQPPPKPFSVTLQINLNRYFNRGDIDHILLEYCPDTIGRDIIKWKADIDPETIKAETPLLPSISYMIYLEAFNYYTGILTNALLKQKRAEGKAIERKERKRQVRKPRSLHDTELNTVTTLIEYRDNLPLFKDAFKKEQIEKQINLTNFIKLSNTYGFLTDAILSYLQEYREAKHNGKAINTVTIGKFTPTDGGKIPLPFSEEIAITDNFNSFCEMAGVTDRNQRQELLTEIRENRFSKIGLTNINLRKKDFQFTQTSLMLYDFTYKKMGQLKNLKNTDETEAIDTIKLRINKDIFNAVLLTDKRNTGTRGYLLYPNRLERWIRQTVKNHSEELAEYCRKQGFKYIKGGDYTTSIRPLFNFLARETTGSYIVENGKRLLVVNKPISSYAKTVCEQTFFTDKQGNRKFKKSVAVEYITYALEVLKHLYADGTENINIHSYAFTPDNLIIKLGERQRQLYAKQG